MADSRSLMIEVFENAGLKPWRKYIDYVRRARDEGALDLIPFLEAYDALPPRKQVFATPEQVCELAGIAPKLIFGHVAGQLWDLGYTQANMMLAVNHPAIVRKAIEQAKRPSGIKDRENLLKANGVIPIPKNQSVHFSFHKHVKSSGGPDEKDAAPAVLPSFEADMDEIDVDEMPLLPPGT